MTEYARAFAPDGLTPLAFGPCPVCAAFGAGQPPHGWDVPCPQALAREAAYVDKLGAERTYFERASFTTMDTSGAMQSMAKNFGRIVGEDEE